MMTKNLDPVAEKIWSLTLEIISLLSGEDYMIVRKPSDCVPPSDGPLVSDGPPGTRSPSPVPPPHSLTHDRNREQKILELTNKMMSLLTGEVELRTYRTAEPTKIHVVERNVWRPGRGGLPAKPRIPERQRPAGKTV
ncbi:gastrula zinc finger protein XlCGF53.1-like [Spea bombifrons]|uniref:gastrula zinc finger protein XlCGF53.1-like n=1 Tax=Spea bombifrons TaxID=233779 RepID=UPI002349CBDD|nr:gastrula zinc finger protein XlCGF53.1-like [Spea bombifrons]